MEGNKFAVPLAEGKLTPHFGHCVSFALIDVKGKEIEKREDVVPPPHEPGLLPRWLGERGVNVIIAGGMGSRAQELFAAGGIKVVAGASREAPEALVKAYLEGTLVTGANACDH